VSCGVEMVIDKHGGNTSRWGLHWLRWTIRYGLPMPWHEWQPRVDLRHGNTICLFISLSVCQLSLCIYICLWRFTQDWIFGLV